MGDILAQKIELGSSKKEVEYDLVRAAQVGVLGFVMNGFFIHHWYHSLDRVVGPSMTCKVGVWMKVAADQLIYAPFSIATFFYFTSFRESGDVGEANKEFMPKMKQSFVQTFVADCALWPLANFVNFRFVALTHRPAFTAVVQLMWQTYMSAISNTGHTKAEVREARHEAGPALVLCSNTVK